MLTLPPLYPIIDFSCFAAQPDPITAIVRYAEELIVGWRDVDPAARQVSAGTTATISELCAGAASCDLGCWNNGYWNNAQGHADHQ